MSRRNSRFLQLDHPAEKVDGRMFRFSPTRWWLHCLFYYITVSCLQETRAVMQAKDAGHMLQTF